VKNNRYVDIRAAEKGLFKTVGKELIESGYGMALVSEEQLLVRDEIPFPKLIVHIDLSGLEMDWQDHLNQISKDLRKDSSVIGFLITIPSELLLQHDIDRVLKHFLLWNKDLYIEVIFNTYPAPSELGLILNRFRTLSVKKLSLKGELPVLSESEVEPYIDAIADNREVIENTAFEVSFLKSFLPGKCNYLDSNEFAIVIIEQSLCICPLRKEGLSLKDKKIQDAKKDLGLQKEKIIQRRLADYMWKNKTFDCQKCLEESGFNG